MVELLAEQFILYACPVGDLATQLDGYFTESERCCGRNAAHNYMPHCTLTGFFRDRAEAVELYQGAIAQALSAQLAADANAPIRIQGLNFRPDWHGLELQSDWLQHFAASFAAFAHSPTRPEPLRLKTWLHLSLAYDFPSEHAQTLQHLAQTYINPYAPVTWEIRFYQRHPNHRWICHFTWPLPAFQSKAS